MIIIVSFTNFQNDLKDMMKEIAGRISIVQPIVNYKLAFIEIELETHNNIVILFKPAFAEVIKGTRPDYYWTNSYDVDDYYRHCHDVKCLSTFVELALLVLEECQKDEEQRSLIKNLDVKYCDVPELKFDIKCDCLEEDQIESYLNTIKRIMGDDSKTCSFYENFEERHDENHIYKDELKEGAKE